MTRIAPQSGTAFTLRRGQRLRVIAPFAEQVGDLVAFGLDDAREWMSNGRTIDYNGTVALTAGHTLFSNRGNPMLRIVEDTAGHHDFLLAPCSLEMFRTLHHFEGEQHPSCFGNLVAALGAHGIEPDSIPTAFNVFMHVEVGMGGGLTIHPPSSAAGDHVDLVAEMDLLVGLTACSAEQTNNGSFKPIDFEISD